MNKKNKELAKKHGFHDAKYIGVWNNYKVYEAIFTDGEVHYIGYPQYILCKDNETRWCKDYEESMEIMTAL